jgi:hypothetical protein
MKIILIFFLAVIVLINIVVSIRIARGLDYEPIQKIAQYALVWFLPIIGALVVHHFVLEKPSTLRKEPDHFVDSGHGDFYRNNSAADDFSGNESDGSD